MARFLRWHSVRSVSKHVLGLGALVVGFVSIIFASPARHFHVGIGDYADEDSRNSEDIARADAPPTYSQSTYSCDSGGCGEGGEGCACGCGEGEGK